VKYVAPGALAEWRSTIPVRAFSQHHAASVLLAGSLPTTASDDVLADLKEMVTALGRRDILSMLSPFGVLGSHERTLLLKAGLEVDERLFAAFRELEELGATYDILMIEDEPALRRIIDDAKRHVMRAETINSLVDGPFVEAWMQSNIATAKRTVSEAKKVRIRVAYERSREFGEAIEKLLNEGRYQEAVALLHDVDWSQTATPGSSARETMWRSDAIKEFAEPLRTLQALGGIERRARRTMDRGRDGRGTTRNRKARALHFC
jgi:hypothetical protein